MTSRGKRRRKSMEKSVNFGQFIHAAQGRTISKLSLSEKKQAKARYKLRKLPSAKMK